MNRLQSHDERGATGVEYGLLITFVAALILGAIFALGTHTSAAFDKHCSELAAVGHGC